ncbi:MAG TPA: cytochrome c peroxidase [Thermodesulfobacteriota bacterium]|nr:cytochrome c peroxidase [Thermodesulfobacteriota bacterium]
MDKDRISKKHFHLFAGKSISGRFPSLLFRWRLCAIGLALMGVAFAGLGYDALYSQAGAADSVTLTDIELLGKYVFWDKISVPAGAMGCFTCHDSRTGWVHKDTKTHQRQVVATSADRTKTGTVKPPANAYATFIPPFFSDCPFGLPGLCGGNFWNGRAEGNEFPVFPDGATEHAFDEVFYDASGVFHPELEAAYGKYLGPVADQALNPFPNPAEQNISRLGVCEHVASASYAPLFKKVWGEPIDLGLRLDISFKRIAVALAAYQASPDVNSFTSKRDNALKRELDGIDIDDTPGAFPLVGLTDQENYGHDLFYATRFSPIVVDGVTKFSNCGFCHSDNPGVDTGVESFQCYADDAYHNIGVPVNTAIPNGGKNPDEGLAGHTGDPTHLGNFKTPCLRNVDKRPSTTFIKAYTHNGWFKSLESLVHFYNTADVNGATAASYGITRCPDCVRSESGAKKRNCWPAPAYDNLSAIPFLVGDLGLTPEDEAAIVAYLKTFTDTYTATRPRPYRTR